MVDPYRYNKMAPFYFTVHMRTINQVRDDEMAAIPVFDTMQILRKRWICPMAATGMKQKEGGGECGAARGDEALEMARMTSNSVAEAGDGGGGEGAEGEGSCS